MYSTIYLWDKTLRLHYWHSWKIVLGSDLYHLYKILLLYKKIAKKHSQMKNKLQNCKFCPCTKQYHITWNAAQQNRTRPPHDKSKANWLLEPSFEGGCINELLYFSPTPSHVFSPSTTTSAFDSGRVYSSTGTSSTVQETTHIKYFNRTVTSYLHSCTISWAQRTPLGCCPVWKPAAIL